MSGSARLTSIDAVSRLATALRRFAEEANATLGSLELELHRAVEYFQHDRREYWTHQLRVGRDRVSEARITLQRREIMTVAGHRPACDEERKALEMAKRRVRTAEEKEEIVRRWARLLDREVIEFRGNLSPLAGWLLLDQAKAVALLDRLSRALEAYVAVTGLGAEPPADLSGLIAAATAAAADASQTAGAAPPSGSGDAASDTSGQSGQESQP